MQSRSILIAFKDFDIVGGVAASPWVGFAHFQDFFNSFFFWKLIRNTLMINLFLIVFVFPMPILLAILLNEVKKGKFKKLVQTSTYIPYLRYKSPSCLLLVK